MKFGNTKSPKKDGASSAPRKTSNVTEENPPQETTEAIEPVSKDIEESALQETVSSEAASAEAAEKETEAGKAESAEEKIRKLREEKAGLMDQLLRKQAEFENFRKRTEREKADFMRFANFEMVRDLLPVLDGFERALTLESGESMEGFKKGMELVRRQLLDGLKKAGLEPIESVGKKFDPNFHQAVVRAEKEGVEEDEVIEEFQRGYLFQGRLLRAAMVKVATGHKASPAEEKTAEEPTIQ